MKSLKTLLTDASAYRARARAALRGKWGTALVTALLGDLIGGTGPTRTYRLIIESGKLPRFSTPDLIYEFHRSALGMTVPVALMIGQVLLIARLILGGVMHLGSARYNLNLIDGREAGVRDLFSGFPRFRDGLVMHLIRTVLTVAGSLLAVVPGLVVRYGFAMAPYILAEDPTCTGRESLKRSWEMMKGHKLELLMLELSFIGWEILSAFSFGAGPLFLNPYKAAARAGFYRTLRADTNS